MAVIGREPVSVADTDYYTGKVVLVTGGAGSIGSVLVQKLCGLGVASVIAVDWSENGIYQLINETSGSVICRIGDIKTARLDSLMRQYRPQVVFHAAAYKHCPLLQDNVIEAFNNNIGGVLNVLRNCREYNVETLVLVSTDKAVNPKSVMGATKLLCEMLMQSSTNAITKMCAVRFGNVMQSSGSVIPLWVKQIERGENVTVTHPDMTRFFMSKSDAAALMLQAGAMARGKDTFFLQMGEPVSIMELAKSIIELYRSNSEVEIIGLRKGEKLSEELTYGDEVTEQTECDRICRVTGEREVEELEIMVSEVLQKTMAYPADAEELVCGLFSKLEISIEGCPH